MSLTFAEYLIITDIQGNELLKIRLPNVTTMRKIKGGGISRCLITDRNSIQYSFRIDDGTWPQKDG